MEIRQLLNYHETIVLKLCYYSIRIFLAYEYVLNHSPEFYLDKFVQFTLQKLSAVNFTVNKEESELLVLSREQWNLKQNCRARFFFEISNKFMQVEHKRYDR